MPFFLDCEDKHRIPFGSDLTVIATASRNPFKCFIRYNSTIEYTKYKIECLCFIRSTHSLHHSSVIRCVSNLC